MFEGPDPVFNTESVPIEHLQQNLQTFTDAKFLL
jgi:hypothetical protein